MNIDTAKCKFVHTRKVTHISASGTWRARFTSERRREIFSTDIGMTEEVRAGGFITDRPQQASLTGKNMRLTTKGNYLKTVEYEVLTLFRESSPILMCLI